MSRNIVLVILDSVRKDYFDRYASCLREQADTSFEQCRTASTWSTPSHASMFTGTLPHQHGVHTYQRSFSGLSPSDTFLGEFKDFKLIGVSSNVYLGSSYGFDEVFDEFVDINPSVRYPDSWKDHQWEGRARYLEIAVQSLLANRPKEYISNAVSLGCSSVFDGLPLPSPYDDGAVPISRAAKRRASESPEPFFMFLNFMDAHQPLSPHVGFDDSLYSVHNSWTSKEGFYQTKWGINARGEIEEHGKFLSNYRGLYTAAVEYLDRKVSTLVNDIQRLTDRPTTFIITSDHGENLGFEADGYQFEHTNSLSEALLHVPLILINTPGDGGGTVDSYVSQVRMGELVTRLATGEMPDITDDRIAAEVLGLSPGKGLQEEKAALTDTDRKEMERTIRATYCGKDKFLWDSQGKSLRYRLDPGAPSSQELVDRETSIPNSALNLFEEDILRSRSTALETEALHPGEIDGQTKERLQDLGYM